MIFPNDYDFVMGGRNRRLQKSIEERDQKLKEFAENPYMFSSSLDEALNTNHVTSQAEALARMFARENVFISGLAGSGKTTVVKRFIDHVESEFDDFNIAVTASTGIAATILGGQTIHSWAGLGISKAPFDPRNIESSVWGKYFIIEKTDILIIDEISMLPAYLFIKLDKILKYVKHNDKPFGGIQLVLVGDFLQLPPVPSKDADCRFAIETEEWQEAHISHCFLDQTRRTNDKKLEKILTDISSNTVDDESRGYLESRMNLDDNSGKSFVNLYTTNKNVDKFNKEQLEKNPNPSMFFRARHDFGDKANIEKLIRKNNIPEVVELKVGATVIVTKNFYYTNGEFIPNGSVGTVIGFKSDHGEPSAEVKLNNGKIIQLYKTRTEMTDKRIEYKEDKKIPYKVVVACVSQIPLKLGYATTVHKSQGQTYDGVVCDLSTCFQPGLGYVALSRVKSLDDLYIQGFSQKALKISENALKISQYIKKEALEARKEFIENKDKYDELLTNPLQRELYWTKD